MADSKDEPMGALGQVANARSKLTDISKNFYGNDPSLGESMGSVVRELMPTQADKERSSSMAFWGGFGAPNNSGSLSGQLGNAISAQSNRELEGERLKASYVPMITQAMLANQQQTLAADKQRYDQAASASGPINSAIASLVANGNKPTVKDIHTTIDRAGGQLGITPYMLKSYHENVPTDDKDAAAHSSRIGQLINPQGFGNTASRDAAGKTTIIAAGPGTIAEPNQNAQGKNLNPTAGEASFNASALGDPKEYSQQLQGQAESATTLIKDLNEISKNTSNYAPGKFAERAGDLAASLKDLGGRIPGMDKSKLESISNTLLNAPEGSKDSLGALQMTKQLLSINAMMSAREAAGGRASMPEFNAAHLAALASTSDPVTFAKFDKFARENAERTIDRMEKFNVHLSDAGPKDKSILGFESNYRRNLLNDLNKKNVDEKVERKAATEAAAPAEVKAAPAVAKAEAIDLKNYPAGTKLSASGKAFITNSDGSHSYVKATK